MMVSDEEKKVLPITVVIPTLAGEALGQTIATLNDGVMQPYEILICVPVVEALRASAFAGGNVRVVVCEQRGQVAQRALGFTQATQSFVLQLDDDVLVLQDDLQKLIDAQTALGPGHAVAPIYVDRHSGEGLHRLPLGLNGCLRSLRTWLVAGAPWGAARMGRVSPAGTNYGVDASRAKRKIVDVEWLPGGCVLHRRNALVLEPYFPFAGKAYCEDLIHSHLLRRRGVNLRIVIDATCKTYGGARTGNMKEFANDFRARQYFQKIRGVMGPRFWLVYMLLFLKMSISLIGDTLHKLPRVIRQRLAG